MINSPIHAYINETKVEQLNPGFLSYISSLTEVANVSPGVARSIVEELADQRHNLKLIASENYSSLATQLAMGNLLTDKYAEGYPGHRFYAGCDNIDDVEALACDLTGRQAESVLRECGLTLNRNALPFDPNGPWYTSGLRIGTPVITTLGMGEAEMVEIASIIELVLSKAESAPITSGKNAGKLSRAKHTLDQAVLNQATARVNVLLERFPVYPELDLVFLRKHFQSSHVETRQIQSAPREPYVQIFGKTRRF